MRRPPQKPAEINKMVGPASVATTLDRDQRQIYESVRGRQNLGRMLVAHFAHCSGQMAYRDEPLQRCGFQYSTSEDTAPGEQAYLAVGAEDSTGNGAKAGLNPFDSLFRKNNRG